MSLRNSLVLLGLLSFIGCREPAKEPTLAERAWGQEEDSEPGTGIGTKDSGSSSDSSSDSSSEDAGAETGTGTDIDTIKSEVVAPLSRDGLIASLHPEIPPSKDEETMLRAGRDAPGAAPPSSRRDVLTRRLLVAWARRDLAGTAALVLALPEAPREDALTDLVPHFAPSLEPKDMPTFLAFADLPEPATRRLLGRCARGLALVNPEAARACHEALGDRGDRAALHVARDLATKDKDAAAVWISLIRDEALRDEAGAEVGAEQGEDGLDAIEDHLRDWARTRALVRLAAERPQAALVGADSVADPVRRAEVLEAAAWGWVNQGFPDLAQQALKDTEATTAQVPLRRAFERVNGKDPEVTRKTLPPGACKDSDDPHLVGACRARHAEDAIARGDRSGARAALQTIPDAAWRAAALIPLFQGLDAAQAREWLGRSKALRDSLPPATRERHLLALLERCDLPPAAHLRDGLALLEDPALRRQLIEDSGAQLSTAEAISLLEALTDQSERALLCVTVLERP